MRIGEICIREVVCAPAETSVQQAAQLMRRHHVGALLITEERAGKRYPMGIVTDRDVVVGVVAEGLVPGVITVGDIMGGELVTVGESEEVFEVIQKMRFKGVRRVPVVEETGVLVGVLAVDDLVDLLAESLTDLSKLIAREQFREQQTRK